MSSSGSEILSSSVTPDRDIDYQSNQSGSIGGFNPRESEDLLAKAISDSIRGDFQDM